MKVASAHGANGPEPALATPFGAALALLVERVPGALGAAFVDGEGEAVDFAGRIDAFDIKVAAAHARILMHHIDAFERLGAPRWLTVRARRRTLHARLLPEGYALVVVLARRAGFVSAPRTFDQCERALREEGALGPPMGPAPSRPVAVRADSRGRPRALLTLAGSEVLVDVLGRVGGLPPGSRGYRVRASDGAELTLVREPGSSWFAEDDTAPAAHSIDSTR